MRLHAMIKTPLQIEGKGRSASTRRTTLFHHARSTALENSTRSTDSDSLRRGIYRGFTAGFPSSHYSSLSFLFFDSFRARQSGGLGRVRSRRWNGRRFFWILAHPLDVVKSRMQADDLARPARRSERRRLRDKVARLALLHADSFPVCFASFLRRHLFCRRHDILRSSIVIGKTIDVVTSHPSPIPEEIFKRDSYISVCIH